MESTIAMSTGWAATTTLRTLIRGRISSLLSFSLAFRALNLLVLTPLTATIMRLFMIRWGRASIGNFEIAAFLLSPLGIAAMMVVGTVSLAIFYLEQAGLIRLLADPKLRWWQAFAGLGPRAPRLIELGLRQLGVLLMLAAPFLAAIGGLYLWLWKDADLYALIVLKPPLFWRGIVPAGCLLAMAGLLGIWVLGRWVLALPAVLLAPGTSARKALGQSWEISRGHWKAVVGVVGGWLLAQGLLSVVVLGALQVASDWLLDRASSSLEVVLITTAIVLAVDVVVAAGLTILGSVVLSALVLGLYRAVGGLENLQVQEDVRDAAGWKPLRWVLVGTGVGLLVLVSTIEYASYLIISDIDLEDRVQITAHRAGSKLGPENTIGALKRSIEAGADWAEIDVQLTSDGALAVIHDTDTLRVSGVRHVVDRTPFETIQALDVGSPFNADFAGERIPSLDQMLAAADDRIGMTIELKIKSVGEVEAMVGAVLDDLRKAPGNARQHRICSQSLDGMKQAKRLEPSLAVGFIAGAAIGDLTRLDVDFLMVNASMATRSLLAAANARGLPVHTWTVNDVDLMTRLIDRGVTNIITSNPVPMIKRLNELRELGPVERLLVRVRHLISD